MKRLLYLVLAAILALSLTGCGRISSTIEITCDTSKVYSTADIHDAMDVVRTYFRRHFDGCTMTAIGYIGDEKADDMEGFAKQYGVDEVIVLVSDFETGSSGGDGSLTPNDTYGNYKWILLREKDGSWSHADHGYG
jgi:hypothetical protein